jgi:O-antigen/teichoic acid export membrane protein
MNHKLSFIENIKNIYLIGRAQIVTLICSILKNKAAAVTVGASGVGWIALISSTIIFLTQLSSLGVDRSSVRHFARMSSDGKKNNTIVLFKTLSFVNNIIALFCFFAIVLMGNVIIDDVLDGNGSYLDVAVVAYSVSMNIISFKYSSLMQGRSEIQTTTKINILTSILSLIAVLPIYIYGDLEILSLSVLLSSVIAFILYKSYHTKKYSEYKTRTRIRIKHFRYAWGMLKNQSAALYFCGIMNSGVNILVISLIGTAFSFSEVGFYTAAMAIATLSTTVLLQLMNLSLHPKLSAIKCESDKSILVTNQIEFNLRAYLPIFLIMLLFLESFITILYGEEFKHSILCLPWLMMACIIQMITYPIRTLLISTKKSMPVLVTDTVLRLGFLLSVYCFTLEKGIEAISIGYLSVYFLYSLTIFVHTYRKYKYFPSINCVRTIAIALSLVLIGYSAFLTDNSITLMVAILLSSIQLFLSLYRILQSKI